MSGRDGPDVRQGVDAASRTDAGLSLVELLIVIVILGILATVVTFAVRGLTDKGVSAVCASDRATLSTAIELYLGQQDVTTIAGADAPARMQVLVDAGLLHSASAHYEIH